MSCCFQIERITLPRQFLFDSLRLYARFQSTAVDLLTLRFDLTQASAERIIPLNVQLKVPSARSKFALVLQIRIINMRTATSEVTIDLSASQWSQFQYVFQTDLGRVSAFANIIEQYSLPKEYEATPSQESMISQVSEASSQNKGFFSENRKFKKQSTSKQLKTNDEYELLSNKERPNDAQFVHFQT